MLTRFAIIRCFTLILCLHGSQLSALGTILFDGRTTPVYKANPTSFHSNAGNLAVGYVRFGGGFTVSFSSSAYLDTFITVSAGIDLRDTGTLDLLSDLFLSSNFTLSNSGLVGGRINGRGNTIHMKGDLKLPSNRLLQFISNTIIDGHGNNLILGPEAQILVDTLTTLTLQNMTIQNSVNSENRPMIRVMDQTGKLALKNVVLDLTGNWVFRNGQLFIHDDVVVTGTSMFSYKSTLSSFVTSGATWYFGPNTGLQYYPSSKSKDLIWLQDNTSSLYLDNASLLATSTGIRLAQGNMFLDNTVTLSSMTGQQATIPTLVSHVPCGAQPLFPFWSPDGRYIVTANHGTFSGQVFAFNGTSATITTTFTAPVNSPDSVNWSPDGRFIVLGTDGDTSIRLYSFDGTRAAFMSSASVTNYPGDARFSPNGKYIAVTSTLFVAPTKTIQIFSFNNISATLLSTLSFTGATNHLQLICWSPDGKYLVLANSVGNLVQVYSFNGSSLSLAASTSVTGCVAVDWSPDGSYIAAGGTGTTLRIFKFNGSLTQVATATAAGSPTFVRWSPDSRFVAASLASNNLVQIFKFNGNNAIVDVSNGGVATSASPMADWSPDGKFLSVACYNANALEIFKTNYVSDSPNNTPQAFSNSIVLGNRSLGANYNLNTTLMADARVFVDGKVFDNSI